MSLPHIPPAQLESVWPLVEEGLTRILELCPQPWTPRDVRIRIVRGQCLLFACEDGFFIVERCEDWGAWYLNVWCMYFRPGTGWRRKKELIAQLDSIQKELLCDFIACTSPRPEWMAMLRGYCTEQTRVYRRG